MDNKTNEKSSSLLNEDSKSNHKFELKKELLYFKNDLLKDFNVIESNINEKYSDSINDLNLRLNDYDKKITMLNKKLSDLTNTIIFEKTVKDKIEQLNQFKENINGKIVKHEIKLNLTYNELQNSISKYDKLFGDSVIYTGIIGKSCKFQNFHEFIDYVLQQISSLNSYKEKSSINFNLYKEKLETLINSLKLQITNITSTLTEFTTQNVNNCENRMKNEINIYNDKLNEIKLQNKNYHDDLDKKYNNLMIDWEKLLEIKKEMYSKFDLDVEEFKNENNKLKQKLEENKSEFDLIKDRFTKLSEFIKDVRFRKNIGQEVKINEFSQMSKQIDFIRKQVYDENEQNNLIQKNTKGQSNVNSFFKRKYSDSNIQNNFNKDKFIRKDKRSNTLNYNIKKYKDINSLKNITESKSTNKLKKEENKNNLFDYNMRSNSNEPKNIDFNEFNNINELYGKTGLNEKNIKKSTIHSISEEENDFFLNFEDNQNLSFNDIKQDNDNNISGNNNDINYKISNENTIINDNNQNLNQNKQNKYFNKKTSNDDNTNISKNINLDSNIFNISNDDNTINDNNNINYYDKNNINEKNQKNNNNKNENYNNKSHNDSFRTENKTIKDLKNKFLQNELNIIKRDKKIIHFSSPIDKILNDKNCNNLNIRKKNSLDSYSSLTQNKSFNNFQSKLKIKIKDKSDEHEISNNISKLINDNQVKNKNVILSLSPRNKESFLRNKNILFENILYSTMKENEKKILNNFQNKEAGIININFDDKNKMTLKKGIESYNGNFKTAKLKLDEKNIKVHKLKKFYFKSSRNFSDEHLSVINKNKKIKITDNKLLSQTLSFNNFHNFEDKVLYFPNVLNNFENGK